MNKKPVTYYVQYFIETAAGFERVHVEKQAHNREAALRRMAELEQRKDVYRVGLLTSDSRAIKTLYPDA